MPEDVHEAAAIDGADRWQTLRHVTLPLLKKHVVLVVTLGLIGTWQVFDQIYVHERGAGKTMTPAYLTYTTGPGRAGSAGRRRSPSCVFLIILVFTVFQRVVTRDKDDRHDRRRHGDAATLVGERRPHAGQAGSAATRSWRSSR